MCPVTISPTPPRASRSWMATSVSVTSPSGPPADSDVPERTMRFRVSTGPSRPGSRRIVEPLQFSRPILRAAGGVSIKPVAQTETPVVPEPRMDTRRAAPEQHRAMVELDAAVTLDPALRELVRLRASILNGCAYCIQLHSRDALAAGEQPHRLHAVAAWEESPFFTARERAALRF